MEGPRYRVLIADDSEEDRNLIAAKLRSEGYALTIAENGDQALKLLLDGPHDLLLLRAGMSETSGRDVLKAMAADPSLRDVPVVMVLAPDNISDIPDYIRMGADDYLLLPIDSTLLLARVAVNLEKERHRDEERDYVRAMEADRRRYDRLFDAVFPASIAEELKTTNKVQPRRFENVALLFADVVGFTAYCSQRSPDEVLENLQEMVVACEAVAAKHNLQKLKTIGDCFMAAAGLLKPVENPVLESVRCGLEMISLVRMLSAGWTLRVGIHIGSVITGMVGYRQYLYDVFGDTVNTAAHIQSYGTVGAVNLSPEAWACVSSMFDGHSAGFVNLKTKGQIEIFYVLPSGGCHG